MNEAIKRIITCALIGIIFASVFFLLPVPFFSAFLAIILLLILLFEWPKLMPINNLQFWLITPLYPILPFILLIIMNHSHRSLLLLLFIMVFSYDIGAYLMGSLFGRHRIWPSISPGKTWEGFFGGVLMCFMTTVLATKNLNIPTQPLTLLFSLLVCMVAALGDFFESWLKRRVHIKDTGKFLPGHGGLLDRFDGILFVSFLFYILFILIHHQI